MKKLILGLLFLNSIWMQSQSERFPKTPEEMESYLIGYWKKSMSAKSATRFLIEKIDNDYYLSTGIFQKGGLEFKAKDKIRLEIIFKNDSILIENFNSTQVRPSLITFLNSDKMIIGTYNNAEEYLKIE